MEIVSEEELTVMCTKKLLPLFEHMLEQIKDLFVYLIDQCKQLFTSTTTSALLMSRFQEIRRLAREALCLLNDGFLKACEILASYGANKRIYDGIKDEVSRKKIQQFKTFMDTNIERINTAIEDYNEFSDHIQILYDKIIATEGECGKILGAKESRPFWSKVGYAVGGTGLVALLGTGAILLSPVVVPTIVLGTATIAAGTAGAGGMFTGFYMSHFHPTEGDIKAAEETINRLIGLKDRIDQARHCSFTCAELIKHTEKALNSTKSLQVDKSNEKKHPSGSQPLKRVIIPKCSAADENQLKKLSEDDANFNFILDEFEKNMKALLKAANDAKVVTDKCLKSLSE